MRHKYEAGYNYHDLFTVEIDHEKAATVIKEMVDFWSGSEERLAIHDGDYFKAWVQQVAEYVLRNNSKPDGEGYVEDFEAHGIFFTYFGGFEPLPEDIEITGPIEL